MGCGATSTRAAAHRHDSLLCDHLVEAVGLLFALADAVQSRSAQNGILQVIEALLDQVMKHTGLGQARGLNKVVQACLHGGVQAERGGHAASCITFGLRPSERWQSHIIRTSRGPSVAPMDRQLKGLPWRRSAGDLTDVTLCRRCMQQAALPGQGRRWRGPSASDTTSALSLQCT